MSRHFIRHMRRNFAWFVLLVLVWLLCSGVSLAGPLSDRLSTFPNWTDKAPTQAAAGDLMYPDWMAGSWEMTSTLIDLVAPLAPEIVTPGFDSNQSLLNQSVTCQVRFEPRATSMTHSFLLEPRWGKEAIVADRAFNGLNLSRAYLGEQAVKAVKVDPQNPNRQLMVLKGNRLLESTITSRAIETPSETEFITTEVFQQIFRGTAQPHINEVETTTAYRKLGEDLSSIAADQITAVYLSPQDPNYFKARNRPVALYRYRLEFFPT